MKEQKIKLAVFDLDNTLAPLGKGIAPSDIALLKALQARGVTLAVCSGKPVGYLSGFFRQAELDELYLVGENGAVIQKGIEYPPAFYKEIELSAETKETLCSLKEEIMRRIDHPFLQPNQFELTVYPRNDAELSAVNAILREREGSMKGVEIYIHSDCVDFIPMGVTKRSGVERLCETLGIPVDEALSVGDGVNDYPMLALTGVSLGINLPDASLVDRNFSSIGEALTYILQSLDGNS